MCVTGLVVVDTPVFWTPFGQAVIMALIQLGGFGIMSFGALLGFLLAGRLGLKSRISAAAEIKSTGFGDVKAVLLGVLKVSLLTEAALAIALMLRFMIDYGYSPGHALWMGAFHSALVLEFKGQSAAEASQANNDDGAGVRCAGDGS